MPRDLFPHCSPDSSWAGVVLFVSLTSLLAGCSRPAREDLSYDYRVVQSWEIEELSGPPLVQFESVFWEPEDTDELRRLLVEEGIAQGRDCLEIGTGTGLLSILALAYGAQRVVATDINPAAVACARYNAAVQELDEDLDVRQVDPQGPQAFAVIGAKERFDLILSNPPWEEGTVGQAAEHAFFDPQFKLLESLVVGLRQHLKPGGRCLLSYGSVAAIERLQQLAETHQLQLTILDDRTLETLDPVFLPGMLIELRVAPASKLKKPKKPTPPVADEDA